MTTKQSLAMQRQCVEHVVALAESQAGVVSASVREGCRQAALTLAWLERRQELMRALDRLERERPELVELLNAFRGSEIVDVRDAQ